MTVKQRMQTIVDYYKTRRGVGHTRATIHGANSGGGCLLVVSTRRHADMLKGKGCFELATLESFDYQAIGCKKPLLIDNFVLEELFQGAIGEIERLEESLREMSDRVGGHEQKTIKDDNGFEWRYNHETGRIAVVGCDEEEDGYDCDNLEHGRKVLIEMGYIDESNQHVPGSRD